MKIWVCLLAETRAHCIDSSLSIVYSSCSITATVWWTTYRCGCDPLGAARNCHSTTPPLNQPIRTQECRCGLRYFLPLLAEWEGLRYPFSLSHSSPPNSFPYSILC